MAGGCASIPIEDATTLAFPEPLQMPEGYLLKDGYPRATACSGTLSGLQWQYATAGADGIPADVTVGRGVSRILVVDVPASLLAVETIASRDTIVVRPHVAGGLAQRSQVVFPEPFGSTSVHAFNLPEAELLRVAEAVAEAMR